MNCTNPEGKENRMETTTKKQNRKKIIIGVLIAVVVLVAAVIAFVSNYLSIMPLAAAGTAATVRLRWMWMPPRTAWNS